MTSLRARALSRICLLVSGFLLTTPLHAEALRFVGPLRVRDLSPIAQLRLDFVPAHGLTGARGRAFRINYSLANVYLVSDVVADYLVERNRADLLTDADIEEILTREGDVFFFDAEVSTLDFEYIRSLTDRLQLQMAWPVQIRGGGFLDRFIETFHESVGLNTASRDLTARNDVQVVARVGQDNLVFRERGTQAGWGDPSVSLRYSTHLPRRTWLTIEGAVKIPVGDEQRFFSSGEFDYGTQLTFQKQYERNALYLAASYVWVGDFRAFTNFPLNNTPTIATTWERRLSGPNWLVLQGSWSHSTLRGATDTALTDDRTLLSIGWRRQVHENLIATLAITENVIHFKNTPDFGVHVALAWIELDRPPVFVK